MTAARRPVYYGYYLAALAFFLSFVAGAVHLYSRGILVKDQIQDFDASRTEISLAFSVSTAAAALFAPVLGLLLDRYPFRRVMALGTTWLGLGFLLLAQAGTLLQFAVLTALFVAIGTSSIGTVANSALMVNWFDRHRGMAIAIGVSGYSVAGLVMGPISLWMLERFGWRGSYLVFAALCLLVALPLIVLLIRNQKDSTPETPLRAPQQPTVIGWAASFGHIARDPHFWQATLIFGVMSGVFVGLNMHLFLFLTDQGIEAHRAVWILSVEGFFAIVCKPVCGWIVDRKGSRRAILLTVVISVVATTLLPGSDTYVRALIVGSLLGFGFGSILSLQAAMVSRMFSADLYARAYGAMRLTTFPFSVACPLLFGITFDRFGSYEPGFYVAAALLLLLVPLAWRLRPALESTR